MRKLTALLFIGVLVFACSRKTSVAKTEIAAPKVTYTTDIKPIIDKSCSPCHLPAQGGRVANFDNYDSTKKHIANIIARVELPATDPKFMPFRSKKPPLTATEITALKNWKAADAPKE